MGVLLSAVLKLTLEAIDILRFIVIFDYVLYILHVLNIGSGGKLNALRASLNLLLEPLLRPIKRIIPNINGLDLSPLILLLALGFAKNIIYGLLARW